VTKHTVSRLAARLSTGMLIMNVEKACDCGMIRFFIIFWNTLSMVYIKLIWTFLTDRKLYVTVAGERPAECMVPSGVPQGALLSPLLFNIFTSDFQTLTDNQLALLANDSVLFSSHSKANVIIDRLQSVLNTIKINYSTRRIKLNPSKTQVVSFLHPIYL
jgi:hypothetical protein